MRTDYLSLVLSPVRISWTIPVRQTFWLIPFSCGGRWKIWCLCAPFSYFVLFLEPQTQLQYKNKLSHWPVSTVSRSPDNGVKGSMWNPRGTPLCGLCYINRYRNNSVQGRATPLRLCSERWYCKIKKSNAWKCRIVRPLCYGWAIGMNPKRTEIENLV
jgi:hypothetical protein